MIGEKKEVLKFKNTYGKNIRLCFESDIYIARISFHYMSTKSLSSKKNHVRKENKIKF